MKQLINQKSIRILFVLFITISLCLSLSQQQSLKVDDRKIFYLYQNQKDIQNIKFDNDLPDVKFVNCKVKSCKQFKSEKYPALISWGGPGTSYRQISQPTNQALRQYIKNWVHNPLHPLRVFITKMDIPQTIIFAILANIPLYFMFKVLFYNRNKDYKKVQNQQNDKKE